MKTGKCHVSKLEMPLSHLVKGQNIRPVILSLIKKEHQDFDSESYISEEQLNSYRRKYLEDILQQEVGELSHLEEAVVKSISDNELLTTNIEPEMDRQLTIGERVSDRIAAFGGSWTFIISFFLFILLWIAVNIFVLISKPFDPYPFILLNLLLSCLAAIQAPIIMMSQNRQETKDRQRSEHDYKVNLKAELEIRLLHEKIDHLILQQNQRMLEIQQIQVDLMEDIISKINGPEKRNQ
jgi:uncharacterized membrane protein